MGVSIQRKGPKLYVDAQSNSRLVEHFVKTLGIKGLGPASIEKLGINHPSELYEDIDWDILGKNGLKVREELNRPKEYPVILASLGIPGVGKSTAQLICSHIPSFENLHTIATTSIHGIGPTTVDNILSWLAVNSEWVEKLPYKLEIAKSAETEQKDNVRKVCITGKLDMTKQELADHLSRYGFEVIGSVTKDCYAVVSNGEESTKTKQANKYGIPVINYWKSKAIVLKGMF